MKHIARSNLDGTNEEIILQNVSYSMAIAVDSYAGNIYFTDRDKKTVEVAKLDGKYRKVLIQSQMHNLVGLAIDIQRGWVHQELYVRLLHKKCCASNEQNEKIRVLTNSPVAVAGIILPL